MSKASNIVHRYFKKEMKNLTLLLKVNPLQFRVTEITLQHGQEPEMRELDVDEGIFEDLESDGFVEASPLEFNLYLSGLIK